MSGFDDYEFQASSSGPSPYGGGSNVVRNAVIAALVIVGLGAAGYLIFARRTAPSTPPRSATAAAPRAPQQTAADDVERIELPPLDDSDPLVRQRIGLLSSNPLVARWLQTKGLVRNFVVVVENISRGSNPSRHLTALKPPGTFRVMTRGNQTVIDPRSYDRYARIADASASVDASGAGRLYRSFKPLLQMAYDELGTQEPFDAAVQRALGGLLQVPAIDGDIRVEQNGEGIGYEYSDRRLEALTGAQKQLLRMGAKNIRIIQAQLRTFATAARIPLS